jgi:hypothetical protein
MFSGLCTSKKEVSSLKDWSTGFCEISNLFKNVQGLLHHYPELRGNLNKEMSTGFLPVARGIFLNPLKAELNPICHLLAL